ncbi:GNAT family N-acetyltransferase (plasmid) [Photobacterium sp. GJ3]|uniref:GNAT family N-acetyltransferase n=1 Tax=Photobacterium sp. GJ3 TaxID=2829502 RepID=UPI001B8AC310|nr:GNAT family N-acetyltransferase [Photobacterium sp. GJ3]QUJ70164.1 GNAT family N-acetyltransferase [Photobacterium sp. GJ3]
MAITIRHMEDKDMDGLCDIYSISSVLENTSQFMHLGSKRIGQLFSSSDLITLVADLDGRAVGHVTLFTRQKPKEKHIASTAIAVHPEFHGRGVGSMLMAEAIDLSDNWLNVLRLELEVNTDNAPAIALYRKFGFGLEGEKKMATFKSGQYADLYLMARLASWHQV